MPQNSILYLIITFFCVFCQPVKSQILNSSTSFTGGLTDDGFAILGSYNHYIDKDFNFIQGSVFAAFSENKYSHTEVPYNIFTFNTGYFKNIYINRSMSFKVAVGAGGVVGYEVINHGNNLLESNVFINGESKLIYGFFLGVDSDIYISDSMSVIIKVNEYYHSNSDIGKFVMFVGAGIRFYLN